MSRGQFLNRVAEDIYQVRLPLPFALNIVNVYLLRGTNGWTIVDTGINTSDARQTWRDTFQALDIHPTHIEKIVLTHVHPDHFGLVGWLRELAKEHNHHLPVFVSEREHLQARWVWYGEADINFERWLAHHGLPHQFAFDVASSMGKTIDMTHPHSPIDSFSMIKAGETIQMGERTFQMIHAPGHSDGQLIFYDPRDKLMLSGDHVLMKITPNIGLWEHTDTNPLGNYLDSLAQLKQIDVRLGLPGHKHLIEDWRGRIEGLIQHHDERLTMIHEAVTNGAHTPYEIAQKIFITDRFTPHEWRFAIAETLAHLDFLQRRDVLLDESGTYQYWVTR